MSASSWNLTHDGRSEMAENKNAQQVREITDKLEQGIKELFESERFKEYLRTMSKFYNYSFNNTLLIAMQKPDATLIAGYTAWQKNFDRQVQKGERGIKILAPAPYKSKEEREKLDPATQSAVLDADGKAVTETVEVMRPAFKVVSVFDVSQTDGKELPDIAVDELSGSVENYAAFFEALKLESPVPVAFEEIPGGAKGYYHLEDRRIAIQEGMSEIQTVKTAIHEIAHAKLHAFTPKEKPTLEYCKDRHTKEVEAESVAYTVCQRYGLETSDYSFGYIAGWSSDKETKELKGSLETIRSTAAEMIESIDAKLKELLAKMERSPLLDADVPVYREMANYAYKAGELDAYKASQQANIACKEAIEQAIGARFSDNRFATEAAVEAVLEQFTPQRVQYVLANTIQHKGEDGRISQDIKQWAADIPVCPENSAYFVVSKAHSGLTNLFITEFNRQMEERERDAESAAMKTAASVEVETSAPEAAPTPKPQLTPDERKIRDAVMDTLKAQIAHGNDGILSSYRASDQSFRIMMQHKVRIDGNTVTRNGEPLFAIHRRHAARKTQGCYRELVPKLEYIKKEKTQEARLEKPSIRDQLRASKEAPEQKSATKQKKRDMDLG